jgi:glucose-6-phosphate isomerase
MLRLVFAELVGRTMGDQSAMTKVDAAWQDLKRHRADISATSLNQMFARDARRFDSFSLTLDDLLVDFSKNLVTQETLRLLRQTAELSGLAERRDAVMSGEKGNVSENRAALHTALRAPRNTVITVDGRDVVPEVHAVLDRVRDFAEAVRSGALTGANGEAFRDVVHIGIGGSVLGPAMITQALTPYHHERARVHFVSNVDGAHLHDTLINLEPATTLFLIASKTFTTQETMLNAASARRWVTDALGEGAVAGHFAALSSNLDTVAAFGIPADRTFGFWDWVGGRYSLWSTIGLPVAIAIGADRFGELLAGARRMDEHFATAPLDANIPVTLGLIGVWYRSILEYGSHAIIPYDQRLTRLTAHLQQVDMESNGKSTRLDGTPVTTATAGVLWGEAGTNVQHSFFQLLHQGTDIIPCDFLVAAQPHEDMPGHHDLLLANCLAQSQALMVGRDTETAKALLLEKGMDPVEADALAPHRAFSGNRPSTTLLYRQLDPRTLGMLIAMYEHKVLVQGALWGINSFDQWGVELGKELASDLLPAIQGGAAPSSTDGSTLGLLGALNLMRES